MEPIKVYFDMVERSAVLIKPKQPFFDWMNKIDPETEAFNMHLPAEVFLIQDLEEHEEIEGWLKKNYDFIFCSWMNNWYTDESIWEKKRTFKKFKEWFDYLPVATVWDTMEEPIEKV